MIEMHVAQRAQDRNARVIVTRLQLSKRNYLKSRRHFEKTRCDLFTLSLCYFVAHMLLPHSGMLAGVKHRMDLLALAIPYAGNPKVRYYTVLALANIT